MSTTATTHTYVARPVDSRCQYWAIKLPAGTNLPLTKRLDVPFLRKGANLELAPGEALVESEARHHRKQRGYDVCLTIAADNGIHHIRPTLARKLHIKANGGADIAAEGSGDVAGAIRIAIWLRRQESLVSAIADIVGVE